MLVVLKTGVIMFADVINSVGRALDEQTKGRGFDSHRGQADFSACLVWIYTQSKISKKRTKLFH